MAEIDYAKKLADLETSNRKTVEGLTADLVSSSKITDEALRIKARNEITEKIKSNLAFYNSEKERLQNLYRTSLSNKSEQNRIQVRQNETRLEQERIANQQVANNSQTNADAPQQASKEETANQEADAQAQLSKGLNADNNYDAYDYGSPPSTAAANENPEAKPLVKPITGESFNIGSTSKNNLGIRADELLSDSEWVRNAFMMPSAQLDREVKLNRFFSPADFKFVDTKPGGSIGCNMRPGFTPYADIRRPGRFPDRAPFTVNAIDNGLGFGAGRQWSDHFDDPAQKIWVQFGVPQFNTVTNFLRKAFTYEEMVMVRRGTAPSFLYDVAKMAGGYVLFKAFPVPVMGFLFIKGLNWLFSRPSNKYYSLKPTMHQYWSAVNSLVNIWAINRGLMPKALKMNGTTTTVGRPLEPSSDYMQVYAALFPDFFVNIKAGDTVVSSYIDAFAFANKAQRMANIMFIREYQRIDSLPDNPSGDSEFYGYLSDKLKGIPAGDELNTFMQRGSKESGGNYHSVYSMMAAMLANNYWFKTKLNLNDPEYDPRLKNKTEDSATSIKSTPEVQADINGNGVAQQSANGTGADYAEKQMAGAVSEADKANAPNLTQEQRTAAQESARAKLEKAVSADLNENDSTGRTEGWLDNIIDLVNGKDDYADKVFESLSAQYAQGAAFACFCVDYTGSTSESFNSSYGESKISQDLNSMSTKAKEFRFAIGDGNIAGDTIKAFVETVSDTVMGLTETVTLGISNLMLGLAGSGYIDVPKHWNNSNASIVKMNYSMSLISPYNNVMSQLQNIYIPLFMLLAGIAPRSTGKSSYGAPFICQLFDRGRTQSQLCALESLSVTRGSSNLGFSLDGKALAIDVNFTFISLSEIMHMPITNGGLGEAFQGFGIDDDNMISDYLAVLAGQDMHTQIYAAPRMFMRLAKLSASIGKLGSPHWLASFTHDKSVNGGGLFLITRPLFKLYEAAGVGKSITNNALTGSN